MRVLHVISGIDPVKGGPVAALTGLAESQSKAGLEVTVVSTWCKGHNLELKDRLRQGGISVELIGPAFGRFLSWHRKIPQIMREWVRWADVVHIHGVWEEIQHQGAVASRIACKPYLMRTCGMLDPWSLSQGKWKKKLYMKWRLRRDLNGAAAMHFTAELEKELTIPLNLTAPAIVVPNGINLDEFKHLPTKGTFRAKYGIAPDRPVVVFFSRLHPKKGLELLVPAFAKAINGNQSSPLLAIIGPDSNGYQAKIESMVSKCGLQDRVIFTGMLCGADRVAALADADLFVLPSYQENFGNAAVEALAAGLPVIVSDQVNIYREIQQAGVGGVVPTQIPALAEEIKRWLCDTEFRKKAAAMARPFVWERYDWSNIAQQWTRHYQRLITASQ